MYVDAYLIPIKKRNVAAYKKMATLGRKLWMKHGALSYAEAVGDDLGTPWGGIPYTKVAKCKPGETVVVAWVAYKSKAHKKQVNAKVHADAAMHKAAKAMPFDVKRMTYGGFKTLVVA